MVVDYKKAVKISVTFLTKTKQTTTTTTTTTTNKQTKTFG